MRIWCIIHLNLEVLGAGEKEVSVVRELSTISARVVMDDFVGSLCARHHILLEYNEWEAADIKTFDANTWAICRLARRKLPRTSRPSFLQSSLSLTLFFLFRRLSTKCPLSPYRPEFIRAFPCSLGILGNLSPVTFGRLRRVVNPPYPEPYSSSSLFGALRSRPRW